MLHIIKDRNINIITYGKSKEAMMNLKNKGIKALFSLKSKLGNLRNLSPQLMLDIFDKLIRPIVVYGCDIWSDECCKDSPIETVNVNFCRFILGVSKKTTKMGIYGELGRFPLDIFVKKQAIKYLVHVMNTKNNILREAFSFNKEKKTNWYKSTTLYLPNSDINQLQVNEISKKIKTQQMINIEHQQQASFISQWKNSLNNREENGNNNCKLRTYKLIKLDFKLEPYLEKLNNPELRSIICKFRLSDHKLEIEKGRHNNIVAAQRLCTKCDMNVVEDEKHFLFEMNYLIMKIISSSNIKSRKIFLLNHYIDYSIYRI